MKVDILLPKKWWQKPYYQLSESIYLAGYEVPAGFITDGATSPRLLWWLFPPIGKYLKATVVHDYLIKQGKNRYECDQAFRQCLQELKIKNWRVNVMFTSVVIFGFSKKPGDYIPSKFKKRLWISRIK